MFTFNIFTIWLVFISCKPGYCQKVQNFTQETAVISSLECESLKTEEERSDCDSTVNFESKEDIDERIINTALEETPSIDFISRSRNTSRRRPSSRSSSSTGSSRRSQSSKRVSTNAKTEPFTNVQNSAATARRVNSTRRPSKLSSTSTRSSTRTSKLPKTSRPSTRGSSKSQIFPRRRALVLEISQVLIRPSTKIQDAKLVEKYKFGNTFSPLSSRTSRTSSRQTQSKSASTSTRSPKTTTRRETPRGSQNRGSLTNNSKSRFVNNPQIFPTTKTIHLPNPDKLECGMTLGRKFSEKELEAPTGSYPFMAAIGFKDSHGTITYDCGGSLINKRYVLTAAHCHMAKKPIAVVVLGEHNFATNQDSPVQIFNIQPRDVLVHERFRLSELDSSGFDLALIRLPRDATTFKENSKVNVLPICLPQSTAMHVPSQQNIVIGWGRTNNNPADMGARFSSGVFTNVLRQLAIPEMPISECKQKFYKKLDLNKHICAGGEKGKDTCRGDSGGPLISKQGKKEVMYLKGIVSFGTSKCGQGTPGVFTNVAYYIDWIRKNMAP